MKDHPRPICDDSINASPEQWMADGYPWVWVDSHGWDTEQKPSDRGQRHEQDRQE